MKIGLIAVATPSNGGTFQYTLSMIEALRQPAGHTVTIYTDTNHDYYQSLGFPTRPFVRSRLRQLFDIIANLLRLRLPEPFEDEQILVSPIYTSALLHTRKPFAYTLHDLQEHYYPDNFSWAQRCWRVFFNTRLTKLATRIICESSYVKGDICRFFNVATAKIVVIAAPPLPPRSVTADVMQLAPVVNQLIKSARFIFYPAQFWPHKNHRRLIEAFVQVASGDPEVLLVLTGKPIDEYAAIMAQIDALSLKNRVRHLGYVTKDEMQVLYAHATLLVMPSLFESVSIPVYEAQQAGIPVAASAIFALTEQVGAGGVLFDPLSTTAIADAVLSILLNPAEGRRMGEMGCSQVTAMTFERYAEELQSVIASVSGQVIDTAVI